MKYSLPKKYLWLLLVVISAYNLYFIFLMPSVNLSYLLYIDVLLLVCIAIIGSIEVYQYRKQQRQMKEYQSYDMLIAEQFLDANTMEIVQHDLEVLQQQILYQQEMNHNLQDYIAKWCHEIKIPLAASLLLNEKNPDARLRLDTKEQLEKMNQQLQTVMIGCKVQSNIYDIQIKKVGLEDCIRTSIKNNQFFLIQNHFTVQLEIHDVTVFSDKQWLVYILDQLLNNAIKYKREHPTLLIRSEVIDNKTIVSIEDNGEGIKESDLRRIYEKGFTGSNHHNGQYKSTGMGLYLVKEIITKLGHTIDVESSYGEYTRFTITFIDNRDHFHL